MKKSLLGLGLFTLFVAAHAEDKPKAGDVKRKYSRLFTSLKGVNAAGTVDCTGNFADSEGRCVRVVFNTEEDKVAFSNMLRTLPLVLDGIEVIFEVDGPAVIRGQ